MFAKSRVNCGTLSALNLNITGYFTCYAASVYDMSCMVTLQIANVSSNILNVSSQPEARTGIHAQWRIQTGAVGACAPRLGKLSSR